LKFERGYSSPIGARSWQTLERLDAPAPQRQGEDRWRSSDEAGGAAAAMHIKTGI
jgi:hypothetical protein